MYIALFVSVFCIVVVVGICRAEVIGFVFSVSCFGGVFLSVAVFDFCCNFVDE